MYQSIYYDRSTYTYHLRDDEKGWLDFKYTPELYQIVPNGPLETLDGKRAKPVDKYEWRDTSLYEQDVDKCTRVLIDLYKDSDEGPKQHNIVYFDIECEIGGTLTSEYIKSAPMKMTSVALYDNTMQKWYCLILDEKNQITPVTTDTQEIRRFNTEADMLIDFLNLWEYIDPTIITGWNSGFFDVPYLYYRLCNVLGRDEAVRLSPLQQVDEGEFAGEKISISKATFESLITPIIQRTISCCTQAMKDARKAEVYGNIGGIDNLSQALVGAQMPPSDFDIYIKTLLISDALIDKAKRAGVDEKNTGAAIQSLVKALTAKQGIKINPQYGTWDPSNADIVTFDAAGTAVKTLTA